MSFELVESYRAEIRTRDFVRLTSAETTSFRMAAEDARANNAIEGLANGAVADALFEMLIAEGVPDGLHMDYVESFYRDTAKPQRQAGNVE